MISTLKIFSDVLAVCKGKLLLAEAIWAGLMEAMKFKLCLRIIEFENVNMNE